MYIHSNPCSCPDTINFDTDCYIWLQNAFRPCEVILFKNISTAYTFAMQLCEREHGDTAYTCVCELMQAIERKNDLGHGDEMLSSVVEPFIQTAFVNGMFGFGRVLPQAEIDTYCKYGVVYKEYSDLV